MDRIDEAAWKRLADRMSNIEGDITKPDSYDAFRARFADTGKRHGVEPNAIFHLAVAGRFFGEVAEQLWRAKLIDQADAVGGSDGIDN